MIRGILSILPRRRFGDEKMALHSVRLYPSGAGAACGLSGLWGRQGEIRLGGVRRDAETQEERPQPYNFKKERDLWLEPSSKGSGY